MIAQFIFNVKVLLDERSKIEILKKKIANNNRTKPRISQKKVLTTDYLRNYEKWERSNIIFKQKLKDIESSIRTNEKFILEFLNKYPNLPYHVKHKNKKYSIMAKTVKKQKKNASAETTTKLEIKWLKEKKVLS